MRGGGARCIVASSLGLRSFVLALLGSARASQLTRQHVAWREAKLTRRRVDALALWWLLFAPALWTRQPTLRCRTRRSSSNNSSFSTKQYNSSSKRLIFSNNSSSSSSNSSNNNSSNSSNSSKRALTPMHGASACCRRSGCATWARCCRCPRYRCRRTRSRRHPPCRRRSIASSRRPPTACFMS